MDENLLDGLPHLRAWADKNPDSPFAKALRNPPPMPALDRLWDRLFGDDPPPAA